MNQQHLTDEDLVLHYYGEAADEHLAHCTDCLSRLRELESTLNSIKDSPAVPERGDDYGRQVWLRIAPKLPRKSMPWQVWGSIAAMLVLGVTAFWAGRHSVQPSQADKGFQQRVLLVALMDHFERSQMVLSEIANASNSGDVSYEKGQAEELLEANRLYRQTALANHDLAAAAMLEELEGVLVEIAHTRSGDVDHLRSLIEDRGLAFKVRVYSNKLSSSKGEL